MSKLDDAISNVAYILDTLMAYRNITALGDCNNCGKRETCQYIPKLGEQVRYNCPFYKGKGVGDNMTDYKRFIKDRDEAFIDFVKTGNAKKVRKYYKKYKIDMPKERKVFAAGIYKAVQVCTNIPEDVKTLAIQKCVAIGFNPFIKPYDYDIESEVTT